MQEPHASSTLTADDKHASLHNEIAQCAKELWTQYGEPADRDLAIWLEAEHKLQSVKHASHVKSSASAPARAQVKTSRH